MSAPRGVRSVERGMALLALMAGQRRPMMLKELAERAGMAPAQVHPYLASLRAAGLVEQDAASGRYRLGPLALDLGLVRFRGLDPVGLAAEAAAELAAATGLTLAVAVWGAYGATLVAVREGAEQLHIKARPGTVFSFSGTATGRAFGAFLPDAAARAIAEAERADRSSRRIGPALGFDALGPHLAAARRRGYATIEQPPVPGVTGIAAPVFDRAGQVALVLTMMGPVERLDGAEHADLARALVAAAAGLSARLGHGPPGGGEEGA